MGTTVFPRGFRAAPAAPSGRSNSPPDAYSRRPATGVSRGECTVLAVFCRSGKDIIFSPMSVHPLFIGRSATLASQIVADVREALFERRYRPGEFLGTEKDLAARHGVSRMVARDALRTLQGLGIVEIARGAGGGARITQGNPQLFAEALAVQLELADIDREEIMSAQGAIEGLAAELAARHATPAQVTSLEKIV